MSDNPSKPTVSETAPPSSTSTAESERRSEPRCQFAATAVVIETRSGMRFNTRTSDLGPGGCYLDTINPLPEGTPVQVCVTHGNRTFETPARVAYAHPGAGMGVAFTGTRPEQLAILEQWLRQPREVPPIAVKAPPPSSQPAAAVPVERQVLSQLIRVLQEKRVISEEDAISLINRLYS